MPTINPGLVFMVNVLLSVISFHHVGLFGDYYAGEQDMLLALIIGYWVNAAFVVLSQCRPKLLIADISIKDIAIGFSYLFLLAPITSILISMMHNS